MDRYARNRMIDQLQADTAADLADLAARRERRAMGETPSEWVVPPAEQAPPRAAERILTDHQIARLINERIAAALDGFSLDGFSKEVAAAIWQRERKALDQVDQKIVDALRTFSEGSGKAIAERVTALKAEIRDEIALRQLEG